MTLATYTVWHLFGIWILGSFLLGATWIVLVRIEVHLNRRERRAALRAAGSVAGQSGERSSTAHPVNAPQRRRVFDTEELDAIRWDFILEGGRKAERRHRR